MSQIEVWKEKLAELAVFGANVQPGQLVAVLATWKCQPGSRVLAARQ